MINYKQIEYGETLTHPEYGLVLTVKIGEKEYFIRDNSSPERLSDERYEEYKIRRHLVNKQDKHKLKEGRVFWPSLNVADLRKGKYDTSLGTYNKEVLQAEFNKMLTKAKEKQNDNESQPESIDK